MPISYEYIYIYILYSRKSHWGHQKESIWSLWNNQKGLFLNNEFAFNKIISTLTVFFWSFLPTRGVKVSLLKIKLRPIQRLVN